MTKITTIKEKMIFKTKILNIVLVAILGLFLLSWSKNPTSSAEMKLLSKLEVGEKLVYKMLGPTNSILELYAEKPNSSGGLRLLGQWNNVDPWSYLQFSGDRKKCIIGIRQEKNPKAKLLFIDAAKGIVKNIGEVESYISSRDLSYIMYQAQAAADNENTRQFAISILATDTLQLKKIFWQLDYEHKEGVLMMLREKLTNNVIICLAAEEGVVIAQVKYDQSTGTLIEYTDYRVRGIFKKNLLDSEYDQEIRKQSLDKSLCINARNNL